MSELIVELFVAGRTARAKKIVAVVTTALSEGCGPAFSLEVVDVLTDPARALDSGVFVTPVVVKLAPLPPALVVGDVQGAAVSLLPAH